MKITVQAGPHNRKNCPVEVPVSEDIQAGSYAMFFGEKTIPCQIVANDNGKSAVFVVPFLKAGETGDFVLGESQDFPDALSVVRNDSNKYDPACFDVFTHGKLFTTLHVSDAWTRPFLYPVVGPVGNITRTYPLVLDIPGETRDHHHQKSFWTAWGDVNGVDNWSESWKGHGYTRTNDAKIIENGPVRGRILLELDWLAEDKKTRIMAETRTYTFYLLDNGEQAVDLKVVFKATDGDVTFGDTKEGGICAVRVASSMDASGKGTIVNSYGATGEAETWGKRAEWCDYYGPVKEGIEGLCIMDNPDNFRFPTFWHVRNYGLMTANPFGTSYFYDDPARNGSHTIKKDSLFVFKYRVFIHEGTTQEATVGERYHDYIKPPMAKVE